MKTYLLRLTVFALICFTVSMPSWGYFFERRTVRLIYFLPNDRPFRPEIIQRMKDEILNIQEYYASQMQAHGYGRKTFRIETDAWGNPIVHRVNGKHPNKYYPKDTIRVWEEIRERFETINIINFIVIDNSTDEITGILSGRASIGGSYALVPSNFNGRVAAHELGHTFGLKHDFREDSYLMSYGLGKRQLSACSAKFLAVSPTFNPQIRNRDTERSTIKLLSSQEYPAGAESVKIQLEVSDPDGLHQVFLMVKTRRPHPARGSDEIIACQGLNGEKKAIVTFDYDGVTPSDGNTSLSDPLLHSISVQIVDAFSNISSVKDFSFKEIFLISESFTLLPAHRKAISGDEQRGVINTPLAAPFVVEIEDQIGRQLVEWPVTFAVTTGGGTLSIENTETDANGRAQTTLTLGPTQGVNTVEIIISGLEPLIFTSFGVKVPRPLLRDGSYQAWSLPLGAVARFGKGAIRTVTFSPDGNTFAVGSSAGIWLYDAKTSRELALLTGHTDTVISVVFSPDGTKLVSVGGWTDGTVKLWDILTGENLATFIDDTNSVRSVALSPDGTLIAAGAHGSFNPGRITLWDIASQTHIATFQGDMSGFSALAFSSDGTALASGSRDGKIRMWDVATGRNTSTLVGHTGSVLSIVFFPDSTKIASAGGRGDNTIKLWDIATGNHILTMRASALTSIALSPDATHIASGEGKRIKLWNVATGTKIATFSGHTGGVGSVAFSPDGTQIVSRSTDQTIKLWDVSTHSAIATIEHALFSIATLSPDGATLAARSGNRKDVKLWDVATGQNTATLVGHTDMLPFLAFSSDGTTLAASLVNNEIQLWDVGTGENTTTLAGHTDIVRSLAFSPDGMTLASGAQDQNVKLWDIATGQDIITLAGPTDTVRSLAFSPDGTTLASGVEKEVILWDIANLQNTATLAGHEYDVESLAFSPDGTTLASGTIQTMLWDVATGKNIATFKNYAAVASLAFSPDGSILATGSDKLKLWDVATGENIATLEGHKRSITYVSFPRNTTTLYSVSYDGTVLLWDMSPYLTPTALPPDVSTLTEDINNDGVVNIVDLTLVASNFGKTGQTAADVNGDGVVNIVDLTLVAGAFGNTAGAPSMWNLHQETVPTRDQVQQWLNQARQVNLTDPTFQRGLLILEYLLTSLTPKETALLPNYPNPFNPETWIPYQLSEPADVSISIYSADGRLVQRLDLGHQPVGMYESRSRAAYWDGRNALGEPVASGVYFYTLTAGEFTATRKMLIRK